MKDKQYKKLVGDLNRVKPVGVYLSLLRDRAKILSENRNIAGVYCIIHKISGKRYIGSSVNLAKRLNYYLSINQNSLLPLLPPHQLEGWYPPSNMVGGESRSAIYRSIKKYGLGEFLIVIVERCGPKDCLVREQHYIDLLIRIGEDYNLNPKAGS